MINITVVYDDTGEKFASPANTVNEALTFIKYPERPHSIYNGNEIKYKSTWPTFKVVTYKYEDYGKRTVKLIKDQEFEVSLANIDEVLKFLSYSNITSPKYIIQIDSDFYLRW